MGFFAWARLNADTLLLALLALGAGFFAVVDPSSDKVTALLDQPATMHYVHAGFLTAAGVLLLAALLAASVRTEVFARCLLLGAVALNLWRHVVWLGWDHSATHQRLAVVVIVGLTMLLRFSVLLGPHALVVTHPGTGERD